MGDARSADDRLPWLDPPRRAAKPVRAARRARTPLLVLLGLFLASAIAVLAYLAGRSMTPVANPAPEVAVRATPVVAPPPAPTPVPSPVPAEPISPPPVVMTPATPPPRAEPPVTIKTVKASKARADWTAPKRVASARSSVRRRAAARAARQARAGSRRYRWPAHFAAAPSGRVVQLGVYYSGRQTNAAWHRLRRAYPYLATLPRKVVMTAPRAGRPRYYRLRIGTRSAGEARALCNRLHRIGRGCIVV